MSKPKRTYYIVDHHLLPKHKKTPLAQFDAWATLRPDGVAISETLGQRGFWRNRADAIIHSSIFGGKPIRGKVTVEQI